MDEYTARLLVYNNQKPDGILMQLSGIIKDWKAKSCERSLLIARVNKQVHALLELSTRCGLDHNLWHAYLAWILATDEVPFSVTNERVPLQEGSINQLAKADLAVFYALFHYDFSALGADLHTDVFDILTAYTAIGKKERAYNRNVSEKVMALCLALENAKNEEEFYRAVTDFYTRFGVGSFGLNQVFRVKKAADGTAQLLPISNLEQVRLKDLVGYEWQKQQLADNTKAFVEGRKANNVLLFGDSGTGKSTSMKALVNEYGNNGLRMIEIYKHQFELLSDVITQIKSRNYRFILYMDDLSFEEFEIEYKYLKAVIEGGMETRPDNLLIYATSNRRHLIRETWKDRDDTDEELHRNDTVEEKLSLVHRFGLTISYSKPNRAEYHEIVKSLALRAGIAVPEDDALFAAADRWEMNHGGLSGRTAGQFVQSLSV